MKNHPPWTKFTDAGKQRSIDEKGQKIHWKPGIDFVLDEKLVAGLPHLFPYPPWHEYFDSYNEAYTRFRHTWILIRRQRPVVPCPERCPLPGKRMSKEQRSKIYSVYFRPWTLAFKVATDTVPYLAHLSKAKETTQTPEGGEHQVANMRKAWKEYAQQVLPHTKVQLQNFMLACMAEGKTHAEEEQESHKRNTSLYCKLTMTEVRAALDFQAKKALQPVTAQDDDPSKRTSQRVLATAEVAIMLAKQTASMHKSESASQLKPVRSHCQLPANLRTNETEKTQIPEEPEDVHTETHDWQAAYRSWYDQTYVRCDDKPKIIPNAQQREVLEMLHDTCAREQRQKHFDAVHIKSAPLRHLVHGLPGSGKSELLRWIRSYFQDVWRWSYGEEFCFLAPLNSMASNIGGNTVHSWGQIGFKDRRGVHIAPKTAENEDTPAMTTKCGKLRFLFVDEIEATGSDIIGALEAHICFHISSQSVYKYAWTMNEAKQYVKALLPRCFGGVNVIFLGDFWQLNPTGQIALMSNPYSDKVLGNAKANFIMSMFWRHDEQTSLLPWKDGSRILHLTRNERSGEDRWFSHVLNRCRDGSLSEDDYNFLHGYPTDARIDFWYAQRNNSEWTHDVHACHYKPYSILDAWNGMPLETHQQTECKDCWSERKRRARVLHLQSHTTEAQERLGDPYFAASVLITQYNMAVFYFAQERAINFAHQSKNQAFWIQAADSPPNWFCNGYSANELLELKKKWLAYHAKKTEGVLSLLLCCYDMPFVVKHSGGPDFKKYGVHNGSRCKLKAWKLDETDDKAVQANTNEAMIVLQAMPKILYLEMEQELKMPYPGLPPKWFAMKPVEIYWTLDNDEHIEIARRGFPLVPNFSTTIDGATGQTLKASIADLGDFGSVPSHHAAMRGYMALSRVTTATFFEYLFKVRTT